MSQSGPLNIISSTSYVNSVTGVAPIQVNGVSGVPESGDVTVSILGSGFVTSVSGTTNRITSSPTTGNVIVDISSSYVGQTSITTLGTVSTGTWNGSVISGQYGGTGFANTGLTINLSSGALNKVLVSDSSGNGSWASLSGIGVTGIIGTANQVLANATSGSTQIGTVTLTTPQDIATTSTVQFAKIGVGTTVQTGFVLDVNGNLIVERGSGSVGPTTTFFGTDQASKTVRVDFDSDTANFVVRGKQSIAAEPPLNTLDVFGSAAIGSFATVNAAPTNGLIVSGDTYLGSASAPSAQLSVVDNGTHAVSLAISGNVSNTSIGVSKALSITSNFNPLVSGLQAFGIDTSITFSTAYTNVYGHRISLNNNATATSLFGIIVDTAAGTGSCTNSYAAYFSNPSMGSSSRIAVYTDNISIGYPTTSPPSNGLIVLGSVAIGTSSANASAQLTMSSTTKGFLPPVMTNTQRNAISSPATGLVIYSTTDSDLEFYNGTSWIGTSISGVTSITATSPLTANGLSGSAQTGAVTIALTTPLSLAFGGTNANLTASNGGIFYSTATAGAILSGTATARQVLLSGASSAPSWSTATYPSTTTINQILYSSANNVISEITASNNGVLISGTSGIPSWLAAGTTGQVLIATTSNPPSWGTLSSLAVTSITGTANQVLANGLTGSAQTGAVTLTLPQSIATTSTVQFSKLGLSVAASNNNLSITGNASVGFGDTAAPTSGLIVSGNTYIGSASPSTLCQLTVSENGNHSISVAFENNIVQTSAGISKGFLINYNFNPFTSGLTAYAFDLTPTYSTAYTTIISQRIAPSNNVSVTSYYGLIVDALGGSGSSTNSYAGYFTNPSMGSSCRIALYSDNLSIGYTTTTPPTNGLIVSGSVAIGTSSATASALLTMSSTTKGFLPPVMTNTQRNAISSPATGLVIYSSTDNDLEFYNGSSWVGATISGVTTISGTSNQIVASSSTGSVTLSFPATGGLSIGSYQATTPPTGGLIMPGVLSVGTSSPNSNTATQVTTSAAYTMYFTGTKTAVDPNNTIGLFAGETFNPTNGNPSGSSTQILVQPTFTIPSTKTTVNAIGVNVNLNYTSNAGTISNAFGILISSGGSSSGTITNSYGAYVQNPTAGTNKIALYSDNAAIGYTGIAPPTNGLIVSGNVGIKTSAPASNVTLDVNGTIASEVQPGFAWLGDISTARWASSLGAFSLSFGNDNSGITNLGSFTAAGITFYTTFSLTPGGVAVASDLQVGGNIVCTANKTKNIGGPTLRFNNVYNASNITGTSRLADSQMTCSTCQTVMKRGTGTIIILGEDADYVPCWCTNPSCPNIGNVKMDAIKHLPDAALGQRQPPPMIKFLGFKVSKVSGKSKTIQANFQYTEEVKDENGKIIEYAKENSTYLSDVEYSNFLKIKTEAGKVNFLKLLGLREWHALEELRLIDNITSTIQSDLDSSVATLTRSDLLKK